MSVYTCQSRLPNFQTILTNFPDVVEPNLIDKPCVEFIAFAKKAFQELAQINKHIEETRKRRVQTDNPLAIHVINRQLSGHTHNYKSQEVEIKLRLSQLLAKETIDHEFTLLAAKAWGSKTDQSSF